ncbi:chloramphenicol acetyltransferase [Flammeovirga yaeyamensis]|uniref:Chloramphenicol acetyltransferase n=1 Tax=Flammeovirga yaeyamensis TaxID=367791 RepID=A0AAX1N9E1_9BACT|nr:CatA-like O-acetyltransferase [Flammeovirga yaeyamensis]MBB3699493.1 chloramphenicol O-acetyltransferase type A [Flammeovirga yaeyamensis]NMF35250.1 chloramphenicol acetyltransferase CAT [Flammeovirga yaeyamensis]QWG04111.1 chloramphenicol acetyltransferase [Flammeovirga yaeyamensis]
MKPIFTTVSEDWKRKPYFDYYYYNIKTKYNINHHIDITDFKNEIKERGLKFFPSMLYVILKIINQSDEFRMGFNEKGKLGCWNYVNPVYTIFHEDDKTFSDMWSEYKPDFQGFYNEIINDIETYKEVREVKARGSQPVNFCPVSSIPWLSFESFSQETYCESTLLYPIIRMGKFYEKDAKVLLPISVFVNHAVADGYHTCKLINDIEEYGKAVSSWI